MSVGPKKAAIIGWPVGHSRSPLIHNHWIEAAGLNAHYGVAPIDPALDFRAELEKLAAKGYVGANVTVPHKQAAFAAMDSLSVAAKSVGAVNTISFKNGRMHGDNTDGDGFLAALDMAAENPAWREQPVLVLGAGGAARAIVAGLARAGVKDIRLSNRTREKAEALLTVSPDMTIGVWQARAELADGCGLLVNTTSLGMQGRPALDMPLHDLARRALVCDIVYAPLETELLAAAKWAGHRPVDGLGMLMHQAALSFDIWFGQKPAVTETLRAALVADLASDLASDSASDLGKEN